MSESKLNTHSEVKLREITEDTVVEICKLSNTLTSTQQKTVAPNAVSIAQAHFSDKAWFRAIYADETPVGFIMLYDDPLKPEYCLWRLMIAGPYQKLGYGKRAIELLCKYVKTRPNAKELVASYVPIDGGPKGFYEKLGFKPTGEMEDDEVVIKLDL